MDAAKRVGEIERRLEAMLAAGVLDEARVNAPGWSPALPSALLAARITCAERFRRMSAKT